MIYTEMGDEKEYRNARVGCIMIIVGCVIVWVAISMVIMNLYHEHRAVRVIVGEAANQGFIGMVAVGEVIRQRGNTEGFVGINAKHIDSEPKWVWEKAKKAWKASETSGYTRGATHFENVKAFGEPDWAKEMSITAIINDHVFYKKEK